jgi:hypothetical protein
VMKSWTKDKDKCKDKDKDKGMYRLSVTLNAKGYTKGKGTLKAATA